MSFLIVGSKKGMYDTEELIQELEIRGVQNPRVVVNDVIKKRKATVCGMKILTLQ